MERPHTVFGLVEKRREFVARLKIAKAEAAQLTANISALDAAIAIFAPDIDASTAREMRLPIPFAAKKNELQAIALEILRTSGTVTSRLIADEFMKRRSIIPDPKGLIAIQNRCSHALSHMHDRGLIRIVERVGRHKAWERVTNPTSGGNVISPHTA